MAGDLDGAQTQEEPQAPENGHEKASQEQPQVGGAPDYESAIVERDLRRWEHIVGLADEEA